MSLFFAIAYLIAEYMRPQSMYDALSGLPLGQVTIIGIIISFIIEGRKLNNSNFQNILILAYLFWFFISFLFAFKRDLAWQPLVDFSKWVIIYFLLINIINDRRRLYIFLIVFLLLNFRYTQFAARIWISNGFYSDPRGLNAGGGIGAGFFQNPNDFGVAINSVLGISYCMIKSDINKIIRWFKMQWFHIVCTVSMIIAIVASSSRGAALGLGVVFLAIWYKSKKKTIGIAFLVIVATAIIALIPDDNRLRFQGMGSEEDGTSQSRLTLWRAGMRMASEYPITGVGPNNFIYVNREHYFSERLEVQHNVYIQAMSELGYPGLIVFLMMIFGCFYNNRKARKILKEKQIDDSFLYGFSHGLDICVIGFIVNGFFITVLYYPFIWMLLILNVALLDVVERLSNDSKNIIYNA
ncbi:MAG: O-antigen ligase family protein [Nitrospirae bacterium]|nr:O-antigen ligase family protein [Nitrospirota bacterium]